MMASTDTYERIAATYADELRMVADEIDRLLDRLDDTGPDRRTWPLALQLAGIAVRGLREKADALDDMPAIAGLWIDDQEGRTDG